MISGVLPCDKPAGRSSHAVVAVARKALGTRRVGHAGTLDPMATGVLVLGVGEGLKILRYLTLDDKRYVARMRLGSETDTLDAEGRVVATAAVPDLTLERVRGAAQRFVGTIVQEAPVISALKQDGVALHARARAGERVQAPSREVVAHSIEVLDVGDAEIELRVHCGKGFYVRSLARDLSRALGTLGHLSALRRTQSGSFGVETCVPFQRVLAAAEGDEAARAALASRVIPIERVLEHAVRVMLDDEGAAHARHGRPIAYSHVLSASAALAEGAEPVLLCDETGRVLAIGRCAAGMLRVVRGLCG